MKRGLNKEASHRGLYVLTLLLMSFGVVAVSMLSLVSVSAGQAPASQSPAGPGVTAADPARSRAV